MSQLITEFLVQNEEAANDTLHRSLFDVNIRLYKNNKQYSDLINQVIDYMVRVLKGGFDDYVNLQGISGANLGIPWNIIAYKQTSPIFPSAVIVMINPKIVYASDEMTTGKSNCGSLRLNESIEIKRHVSIHCSWYDPETHQPKQNVRFVGAIGRTIQHEVEHNQGILITTKG